MKKDPMVKVWKKTWVILRISNRMPESLLKPEKHWNKCYRSAKKGAKSAQKFLIGPGQDIRVEAGYSRASGISFACPSLVGSSVPSSALRKYHSSPSLIWRLFSAQTYSIHSTSSEAGV